MLKSGGTRHWIPEMEVPYVVKGDQWVGYDDPQSLKLKVGRGNRHRPMYDHVP